MEVLLLRQPYQVSFSGNPVAFTFIVTPYTSVEHAEDIGLNITVEVEETFNTQVFTAARQDIYLPDPNGVVEIDVQYILQAYVSQYIPALNLSTAALCEGQTRRYRLSYQLIVNGNLATQLATTGILNVIKSGMPNEEWHPKKFFTEYISNKKLFLRYGYPEEKVHADELKFLNFIYPAENPLVLKVYAEVYYHDNSLEAKDISAPFSCLQWQIMITPAGFQQLGLDTLVNDGRIPLFYDISVVDTTYTKQVAPQRFVLDYRNFYNTYNIMYAGSLGGIETLRLRGLIEASADYARTNAERVQPSNYFAAGVLQSPVATSYASESEKFTGDTGFIPQEKLDRLRDLFLSRDCLYEIRGGRLLPIAIDGKTVKLYTTTDKLYSMSIDWRNAFTNEYYAPDNLLASVSATCPVPESFFVRQVQKSYLQVLWGLEPEYDQVQIEFPGDSGQEMTILDGNTGQQRIYFKNPKVANPADTSAITVRARTVCNSDVDPISVSAWVTVGLVPVGNYPPVAIDDNFTMLRGITTITLLDGNLLTNDYDPDGDPIECVPVNNQTTQKGGKITITRDGKPAYGAPDALFEGEDTYQYQIREVNNPAVTATGYVRITVGSPTSGSVVYARIVLRNVITTRKQATGAGGSFNLADLTTGEVWIDFFADAIGTLPVDVTALALIMNYVITTTIYNPQTTNGQTTGTGTKTKIFQGELAAKNLAGTLFFDYTREFKLAAGTGYSLI